MGAVIDFQEAKKRLETPIAELNPNLNDAVETFAFSRLSAKCRVTLILSGIFGGEPDSYLDKVDDILYYSGTNFSVPYKAKI